MTVTISWQPPRAVEDVETDHELYLLLAAFDPDELSNVLVYRTAVLNDLVTWH